MSLEREFALNTNTDRFFCIQNYQQTLQQLSHQFRSKHRDDKFIIRDGEYNFIKEELNTWTLLYYLESVRNTNNWGDINLLTVSDELYFKSIVDSDPELAQDLVRLHSNFTKY